MKLKILTFILFLFSFSILFSQSTWTGNGDGVSFNDPQNWNPQSVPMFNTTITFNSGTEITITNIPNSYTNATPLTEIRILSNTTVFFDNSGFGSVEIYMTNINIDETSGLILAGTDTISIETENAVISGTIDAGDIHKFETYNSGTVDFNGLANLITANINGYSDSFLGGFSFAATSPYSITYNGSGYQSTGLFNLGISFQNIIIENPHNVSMDNNIQTEILELTEGNFEIGSFNLTVNQHIEYGNGLLSANGASSLTFGDGTGSGNGNAFFINFDPSYNTINTLTVNKPGDITVIESILTIVNQLNIDGGLLRVDAILNISLPSSINASPTNYILTNNDAYVKTTPTAGTPDTIPLGTENSYAPVVINSSASDIFSVNVRDGIFSEGNYGTPLLRNNVYLCWEILPESNTTYTLSLFWGPTVQTGNFVLADSYISNYNGTEWDMPTDIGGVTSGSLYTVTRSGINTSGFFGVFSGTNNFPITSNNTINMAISQVYVFNTDDFNYSDPDGDVFAKIMITQEPANGNLFLDANLNNYPDPDEVINVDTQIFAQNILNGFLKYAPATDAIGTTESFSFAVSDGMNYNQPPDAVMTINITGNHPPIADTEQIFTIPEHSPQGTVVGKINASDPDSDNVYFYPLEGTVYSNAFKLADDGTIAVDNANLLEYSLNPSFEYDIDVCDDGVPVLCTPVRVIINLEEVIRDLTAANFISPNGDGHNDRWLVQGLENDTYEAYIFNSSGKLLFYSPDYKNGWDGTNRGRELPPGVYYYLLKSPNTELKGTITLVR